jgi:hypothetical protein
MNSIVGVINRPDLQERSIVVKAPEIPEEAREQESTMRANFETYSPCIFAAILDAMVATMAAPESDMEGGPRLIDFVRWAAPAIEYLGLGDFYEYFDAMRAEADLTALARDMVAGAIVLFMIEKEKFEGTTTELFTGILNDFRLVEVGSIDPKRWPRSPQAFGQWVTRCAPLLKSAGLTITDLPRSKGARKKLIQWAPGMTPDRRDEVLNAAEFPFHFITTPACENYVADAAERVGIELGQSRY